MIFATCDAATDKPALPLAVRDIYLSDLAATASRTRVE
jgi:hypothetical protein